MMSPIGRGVSMSPMSPLVNQGGCVIEGQLEKRGGGICGKWEGYWFRLTKTSLDYFDVDDPVKIIPQGSLALKKIASVCVDDAISGVGQELHIQVGGRKIRLRLPDAAGESGDSSKESVLDMWCKDMTQTLAVAKGELAEIDEEDEDSVFAEGALKGAAGSQYEEQGGDDGSATTPTRRFKAKGSSKGATRTENLYQCHFQRQARLEEKRRQAEEEELANVVDLSQVLGQLSRSSSAAGRLNGTAASDRLYKDREVLAEKLEVRRRERQEEELLAIERMQRRVGPVDVEELSSRLYEDAYRRRAELEVKRKEESGIRQVEDVSLYVRRHRGPDNTERWKELHEMAGERHAKLQEKREKMMREEDERVNASRVRPHEAHRPLNQQRIQELHDEYLKKQIRQRETSKKLRQEEQKKLDKEQEEKPRNKPVVRQRKTPLHQPLARLQKPPVKEQLALKESQSIGDSDQGAPCLEKQGDAILTSIEAGIALRCVDGQKPSALPSQQRKQIMEHLHGAVSAYREASSQQKKDTGYVALCVRPSQRLVGTQLLCDPDRYARRTEPNSICQVNSDLAWLLDCASIAQEQLKSLIAPQVQWDPKSGVNSPDGIPSAAYAYDPGCQEHRKALIKAQVRYGPATGCRCYRHVLDLARLTIVFNSCDLLQAGIDHLLRNIEVVRIRNFYSAPTRLGAQYVQMLVVVRLGADGETIPHVCELRLEHKAFHHAARVADKHLDAMDASLVEAYSSYTSEHGIDSDKLVEVVRTICGKCPESPKARALRCAFLRHSGSTVSAWRSHLHDARVLPFRRFQELCNMIRCSDLAVELWETLDPGCGGFLTLWELDPEAISLLLMVRQAVLERTRLSADALGSPAEIFNSMTTHVLTTKPQQLEQHEFQKVCKAFGIAPAVADRVFAILDKGGGSGKTPPTIVRAADLHWLMHVVRKVHVDFIALGLGPPLREADGTAPRERKPLSVRPWSGTMASTSSSPGRVSPGGADSSDSPLGSPFFDEQEELEELSVIKEAEAPEDEEDGGSEVAELGGPDELEGLTFEEGSALPGIKEDYEGETEELDAQTTDVGTVGTDLVHFGEHCDESSEHVLGFDDVGTPEWGLGAHEAMESSGAVEEAEGEEVVEEEAMEEEAVEEEAAGEEEAVAEEEATGEEEAAGEEEAGEEEAVEEEAMEEEAVEEEAVEEGVVEEDEEETF